MRVEAEVEKPKGSLCWFEGRNEGTRGPDQLLLPQFIPHCPSLLFPSLFLLFFTPPLLFSSSLLSTSTSFLFSFFLLIPVFLFFWLVTSIWFVLPLLQLRLSHCHWSRRSELIVRSQNYSLTPTLPSSSAQRKPRSTLNWLTRLRASFPASVTGWVCPIGKSKRPSEIYHTRKCTNRTLAS